jgi:hypothetical protein
VIDYITAFREFLQAQGSLTALTVADADRGIYRADIGLPPELDDQSSAPRAVILQGIGGTVNVAYPRIRPRLYARCHAPTGVEAMAIFGALHDCVYPNRQPLPPTLVSGKWFMRSVGLGLPTQDREPESTWPVAVAPVYVEFDPQERSF